MTSKKNVHIFSFLVLILQITKYGFVVCYFCGLSNNFCDCINLEKLVPPIQQHDDCCESKSHIPEEASESKCSLCIFVCEDRNIPNKSSLPNLKLQADICYFYFTNQLSKSKFPHIKHNALCILPPCCITTDILLI